MRRLPRILIPKELKKIEYALLHQKNKGYYFQRIRTIMQIYFMYFTGTRPKECISAKLEYLDFERKTFWIPASSNKQRFSDEIPLPEFLIKKLKDYLIIRKKYYPDSLWMFPTKKGHIEVTVFEKQFREAARKAGILRTCYIDKKNNPRYNISLYNLRMSYGTYVYEKTGHDVKKTAIMLRQRDPLCRSVMFYIAPAEEAMRRENIMNEVWK